MPKKDFPSDVKLRVLKLANSQKSITQICAITKIPESSVRKILKEFGVTAKHGSTKRIDVSQKTEFIRLYEEEGMNPSAIARKCGVSETSVRRFIRNYEAKKNGAWSNIDTPLIPDIEETKDHATVNFDAGGITEHSLAPFDEIRTTEYIRRLNTIQKHDKLNDVYAYDKQGCGGANHVYIVHPFGDDPRNNGDHECLTIIQFQNGPRNDENSSQGVIDTDLLEIVRDRLMAFQFGDYACVENENALRHIDEALLWLNKRVEDRAERGVLGTDII